MEEIQLTNVRRILDEYALKFQALSKTLLEKNGRRATGNLLSSIHTDIEVNGTVYSVILHSEEYLKYLELGTKPHFPPVDKILEWVKTKPLPTRENTGRKDLPTEKQLAYLVARKISQEGTTGIPVIAQTQEQLNEIYITKLQDALKEDITMWMPIIHIQLRFK